MSYAAVFSSHSPLKDYRAPADGVADEVGGRLSAIRRQLAKFDPELLFVIGPDHFNAFFYRLMPSFCIGTHAESIGDWNTPAGEMNVASEIAEKCVSAVHTAGVDAAISYRMEMDHGLTQLLGQLFDDGRIPPIVPIFVNCAAPPLPPIARVVAFGAALGEFVGALDRRVLITASGGLSHDPPIPGLVDAPPEVRERLIAGGRLDSTARAARQDRVLNDAAKQTAGTSERRPLNPEWDQAFLKHLSAGDFAALSAMSDAAITDAAGCGGHEIRAWIAAAAATRALGIAPLRLEYYRAIPEWVAGYGIMTAGL